MGRPFLRLLLLARRDIARVSAGHSQLTKVISIFQISCLKLTWIYHLTNSAAKSSFYLSQSRWQWKWSFITFSLGPWELLSVSPANCWPMDWSLHLRSRQGLLQTLSHHWFDHVEMREDVVLKPWMPFTLRLLCHSAAAGLHGLFSQGLDETTSLGDFKELDGAKPSTFSERESHQLSQNWQSTCEKDVCISWKPYYKDIASRFLWRAVKQTSPLTPAPSPSFPFFPLSQGVFLSPLYFQTA